MPSNGRRVWMRWRFIEAATRARLDDGIGSSAGCGTSNGAPPQATQKPLETIPEAR
jgi:hypothetical protein